MKSKSGWSTDETPNALERRSQAAPEPLGLEPDELDPIIGTVVWTRFASIVDAEKLAGRAGAVLVVDLDRQSRTAAALDPSNQKEILPLLADAIRHAVRSGDQITHLNACRFAVLLHGASQEIADALSARIRQSVEDTIFLISKGLVQVSVNVGDALFEPGTAAEVDVRLAAAKLALVKASTDRNLVQ